MKSFKILSLCFVFAALLTISIFIDPVNASDVKTDITGHTYSVIIDNAVYDMAFRQGPFGPGPAGEVDLSQGGVFVAKYSFTSRGDIIMITDLGNFFYGNYVLVYIPGDTVLLLSCSDCLTR